MTLKRYLCCLLVCLTLLCTVACDHDRPTEDLSQSDGSVGFTVNYLDVNGGDAILVRTGGRTMLIDAGYEETADRMILALRDLGVERIDYLLITHFDKDHVGGVPSLVSEFTVLNIIQPVYEKPTATFYTRYRTAVARSGALVTDLTEPSLLTLGGQSFYLYPGEATAYAEGDNDFSLVVKVTYGAVSFLFAGDVEAARLKEMNDSKINWSATVLKCPHHGTYNKRSETFYNKVSPKYAIITDSDTEPPSPDTLSRLAALGAQVYRTSQGSITVYTDGTDVTVSYQ